MSTQILLSEQLENRSKGNKLKSQRNHRISMIKKYKRNSIILSGVSICCILTKSHSINGGWISKIEWKSQRFHRLYYVVCCTFNEARTSAFNRVGFLRLFCSFLNKSNFMSLVSIVISILLSLGMLFFLYVQMHFCALYFAHATVRLFPSFARRLVPIARQFTASTSKVKLKWRQWRRWN